MKIFSAPFMHYTLMGKSICQYSMCRAEIADATFAIRAEIDGDLGTMHPEHVLDWLLQRGHVETLDSLRDMYFSNFGADDVPERVAETVVPSDEPTTTPYDEYLNQRPMIIVLHQHPNTEIIVRYEPQREKEKYRVIFK